MKQYTGYRIQDTGYRIQDTGFRIQDLRYRIQDTEFISDTGYFQDKGFRIRMQVSGYRMQD